jgi:beta-lactamase regulating signal transducer with metallopeptidase domain
MRSEKVTEAGSDGLLWATVGASWPSAVVTVWLLGMAILTIGGALRYIRFVHLLPRREPTEDEWNQQWYDLLARRNVRWPIPLRMTSHLGPILCRLPGGYQLLLPVGLWRSLSPAARLDILCHELAHFQRGDTWKSLAVRLLALPHWFNPFAWWAVRRFDEAAEWACDQQAADAAPEHKPDYVRALLQLGSQSSAEPACSRAARGRELRVRVRRLLARHPLEDSVMKKLVVIAVAVVLVLVFMMRLDLVAKDPPSKAPARDTSSEAVPPDLDMVSKDPPSKASSRDTSSEAVPTDLSDDLRQASAPAETEPGSTVDETVTLTEPRGTPEEAKSPKLRFNLVLVPWEDVLKWFAEATDLSLVAEATPSGTFSHREQREYSRSEALELLNSALVDKGYALVRRGARLELVKLQDTASAKEVTSAPAREALRYDGKPFSTWKGELKTELKPERRVEAIKAFTAFAAHGYGKEATQAIVEVMRQYDVWIIHRKTPIGQLKQVAIDAFKPRAEDDPNWDSIDPADAVPVLVDELTHGNTNGRLFATRALDIMGPESQAAIGALVAAIQADREPRVRQLASGALAHVDQQGDTTASVVRHLSAKRDGTVLAHLLLNLVPFRWDKYEMQPIQTILRYDSGSSYGSEGAGMASSGYGTMSGGGMASMAMGMGGYGEMKSMPPPVLTERGKVILKVLIEVLDQDDPSVRNVILDTLGRMGPPAADAIPKLRKLLDRAGKDCQIRVAGVLGSIGPKAKEAVPRIIDLFGQVEGRQRAMVAGALAQFGPLAKQAAPVLRRALEDKDRGVRAAVRRALVKIAPGDHEMDMGMGMGYEEDGGYGAGYGEYPGGGYGYGSEGGYGSGMEGYGAAGAMEAYESDEP